MSGPHILDRSFPQLFQEGIIPPAEQPKFVTALKDMMDETRTASVEKLAELQLPAALAKPVDMARVESERAGVCTLSPMPDGQLPKWIVARETTTNQQAS